MNFHSTSTDDSDIGKRLKEIIFHAIQLRREGHGRCSLVGISLIVTTLSDSTFLPNLLYAVDR